MKLLIQQDLDFTWIPPANLTPAELADELDYYRELEQLAKQFSIWGRFALSDARVDVKVFAQKVTLDEVAMNTLFADFLTELFVIETRYAALGGAGCDFSLEVVKAVARNYS